MQGIKLPTGAMGFCGRWTQNWCVCEHTCVAGPWRGRLKIPCPPTRRLCSNEIVLTCPPQELGNQETPDCTFKLPKCMYMYLSVVTCTLAHLVSVQYNWKGKEGDSPLIWGCPARLWDIPAAPSSDQWWLPACPVLNINSFWGETWLEKVICTLTKGVKEPRSRLVCSPTAEALESTSLLHLFLVLFAVQQHFCLYNYTTPSSALL